MAQKAKLEQIREKLEQSDIEIEERKDPHDIASEMVNMFIREYPEGFSLADVREIFSIIEQHFVGLKIQFLDP